MTAAVVALLATTAVPAFAAGVEEIIVTAQRRAENAQKVPISISTVTASTIEALGVINPESIGQLLPGLLLARNGQGVITYVRGVGSGSAVSGNEPSVAMFIDDVYMPNGNGAVFDFNNVDSVSVLKGPQGTLFGRNATGGVIQIKTRDPSQKPELDLDVGYGNYAKTTTAIYANTPITDKVAANFAGYYNDQNEGWGHNVLTGLNVFTSLAYGARGKIKANIGDNTTFVLTAAYDKRISDQGGLSMSILSGTRGFNGWSPNALGVGFYDGATNQWMKFANQSMLLSGKLEHDFGNAILRSITAYQDIRFKLNADSDASPTDWNDGLLHQGSSTFTQELQLLSAADSKIQWILGVYYLNDLVKHHFFNYGGAVAPNQPFDAFARQHTDSRSAFAQMTTEILPKLKATLGIRYTSDERAYKGRVYRAPSAGAEEALITGPLYDKTSFNNTTGRFSLDYQLAPDLMVYAAYNKGFKSGIYNVGATAPGATAPGSVGPVAPEALDAYTIGLKSEFWNHRARFNVEYYYYDYSNIQVSQIVNGNVLLTNGGKATIQGIDTELTVVPVENLTLTWAMSYAHGVYDAFLNGPTFFPLPPNAPIAIPAACGPIAYPSPSGGNAGATRFCNLSGNDTVQTSPFTSNFTASYTIPSQIGDFDLVGSYYYGGKYYFEPDNNPRTRQPAMNLVNASVSWTSPSKMFGLTLWTNNQTGQEYYNSISENTSGGLRYTPAAPRTYGVTAKLKFGG